MTQTCARCGSSNRATAKFCQDCGAPLGAAAVAGERRQLTVMFCDLVESTALAARLDPEEFREALRGYQGACAAIVGRFDGYVAQYLGDGILAYFGYPRAHEDEAERALRAGLEIVDAVGHLPERGGSRLRVRVGVHTGPVVIGALGGGGSREPVASGDAVNLAARLQTVAQPGGLVASGATLRLVPGLFECENLGLQHLKGVVEPVPTYRVVRASGAASRFDLTAGADLTPLVGREAETRLLLDRWERVKRGSGHVVLVQGEAGIGKSRLTHHFREHLSAEPHIWLICRASPYAQTSAFYPLIQLIERALQFEADDSPAARVAKLESRLAAFDVPLDETVPLFAHLLSLPPPTQYAPLVLSPEAQKRRTEQALLRWLFAMAERVPVVFVAEDLHWGDPSSLDLLGRLVESVAAARLLVLLTHRPDYHPTFPAQPHVSAMHLARVPAADSERMIDHLTGGRTLPREVVEQIVRRTDGVPLFVEELTKMILESGLLSARAGAYELDGALPALAIPSTLQDSLMARLDRSAVAKEVAQLGAALGREFGYALLRAIAPHDEATLRDALAQLVDAELLYAQGQPPSGQYVFKHALVQEAAYQSLLKSRRQQIHQQVADALVDRFRDTAETRPELVAHHYTAAGLAEPAIDYWLRAGQRAAKRSGFSEATAHCRRGLEVLAALPESPDRLALELQLQVALGDTLIATTGYGGTDVGRAYGRAREICQAVGDEPRLGFVLGGVWVFYLIRAEYEAARGLAEQLLRLSERMPIPIAIAGAHAAMGSTLMNLGDLPAARAHLERAASFDDDDQLVLASDVRVSALCFLANVLTAQGYLDAALARVDQALARARALGQAFPLANALTQRAWVRHMQSDVAGTRAAADEAISLAGEQGFPYWLTFCLAARGWALMASGDVGTGMTEFARSLAAAEASGTARATAQRLAIMTEASAQIGRLDEARRHLTAAFAHCERTGEGFYLAELHRLRGELAEDGADAEACFRTAIATAERQEAKLFELRAAVSLARLWQARGMRRQARTLLAPVQAWFTEGRNGPDVQAAAALLAEL